jgi:hypothetical protein
MDVSVSLDEQEISNLHVLVRSFRKRMKDEDDVDESLDAMLRKTELRLAGALRSVGWKPLPDGGWVQEAQRRRR